MDLGTSWELLRNHFRQNNSLQEQKHNFLTMLVYYTKSDCISPNDPKSESDDQFETFRKLIGLQGGDFLWKAVLHCTHACHPLAKVQRYISGKGRQNGLIYFGVDSIPLLIYFQNISFC